MIKVIDDPQMFMVHIVGPPVLPQYPRGGQPVQIRAGVPVQAFKIVLQVQYLPVYIGELLHKDPELLIPSAHLQSLRNDVLPDIERYGLPLRLGRQAVSGHGRGLCDSPDKEAIEHCRNILPKTGLALLQDVASAHFVTSLYMSIYTHTIKTKKSPHVNRNVGA